MKVLVAHASKHGSTREMAEEVARELTARGLDTTCIPASEVESVTGYDALVLGAAIYAGSWPKSARKFVSCVTAQAPKVPTWVFSSGPVGEPLGPSALPSGPRELAAKMHLCEHTMFPGVLDRSKLGLLEKGVVGAIKAADGDYRNWDALRDWSGRIAESLMPPTSD